MKNKNNSEHRLIGLLSRPLEKVAYRDSGSKDIRVDIARVKTDNGKTTPRNWSRAFGDPINSTGGCYARIFASSNPGQEDFFAHYGPDTLYGDRRDYEHGAKALKLIEKRLNRLYNVRGPVVDVADEMGRFLEAAGVKEVWLPTGNFSSTWLTETDWKQISVGQLVHDIRPFISVKSAPITATA